MFDSLTNSMDISELYKKYWEGTKFENTIVTVEV